MTDIEETGQINIFDKLKPNEVIKVPVSEEGIGGELLNILSKGLYTNPLDAIREYVQNSIDANSNEVEIQITGNSVWILDHGDGMIREELLMARNFGVSDKSIEENVGFRGIGIYSGFDLCERLVIRTKQYLDNFEHILVFNFGEMRRKLDEARQNPNRPIIPLNILLTDHTNYSYKPSRRINQSFTIVQLEDLSDSHIHKLSNIEEMRSYLLKTLPVKFNNNFKYANDIENHLRKNVPGYKSAKVILKIEKSPQIVIEKPNIPGLEYPKMDFIRDSKGREIAYYWACLTSVSQAISARGFSDFAGFIYKIKGFTIGNATNLQHHFTRRQMYYWWTGEIYVIDTEVVPTSARDDFEASPSKDALELALHELMNGAKNMVSLQKIALTAQATRRADEKVGDCQAKIRKIQIDIASGEFDKPQTYSDLDNIISVLRSQKSKASDKTSATNLYNKATKLQKTIKRLLENPTSISHQRRQAFKTAFDDTTSADETSSVIDKHIYGDEDTGKGLAIEKNFIEPPFKSLLQIVEENGWILDEGLKELIKLIGEAIADNLGPGSETYSQLIIDIEERLTDVTETN